MKGNQEHYLSVLRGVTVYRNGTLLSLGSTQKPIQKTMHFPSANHFPEEHIILPPHIQGLVMTYNDHMYKLSQHPVLHTENL